MKKRRLWALALLLWAAWVHSALAQDKPDETVPLVGRITFIDGQLLRYVHEVRDWVATVKDAPFGLDDALYSNESCKAEFKLPNGAWARVGTDTQIQLIALRDDATEIDIAAGTARFYNKSRDAVIKATTPFGYVVAQPGTAFDLYVGNASAEVISLDGVVEFAHEGNDTKYAIEAGGTSIISDGKRVVEGDGTVDAVWDEWNLSREQLWTRRLQVKGESVQYLPPSLQSDAYDLDRNGKWERVYYGGECRTMWRPVSAGPGWEPFTEGRWTVWHQDNVWIPGEEYGYVTHHYGNWVWVESAACWYWAPPLRVHAGRLGYRAWWYPGRVAWIHAGVEIGWVPLAPGEIYYAHHHWGPGTVLAGGAGHAGIRINLGGLAYVNRAVIVCQSHFYTVDSYAAVRIANSNRTVIVNKYRAAPVLNNTVIGNYSTLRDRFVYNTGLAHVTARPHQTVWARIDRNSALAARRGPAVSARSIEHNMAGMRLGAPMRGGTGGQVQSPRVGGKMATEEQANRPRSEGRLQERGVKSQTRPPRAVRGSQNHTSAPGGAAVKGSGPPSTPRQVVRPPQSGAAQSQVRPPRGQHMQQQKQRMPGGQRGFQAQPPQRRPGMEHGGPGPGGSPGQSPHMPQGPRGGGPQ